MEGGQQSSFHEDADGYGTQGGTHYDTLKVSPTANSTEIRASYRAALLALHPDKATGGAGGVLPFHLDSNSSNPSTDVDISRYLRVQEAWNVLRDAESRAMYDSSLARNGEKRRSRNGDTCLVIGEEVLLEDMEEGGGETGETKEFWYPCRCSDFFVVGQRELEDAGWQVGEDHEYVPIGEGDEGSVILKSSRDGDGDGEEDGAEWGRQRRSIVLPSCLPRPPQKVAAWFMGNAMTEQVKDGWVKTCTDSVVGGKSRSIRRGGSASYIRKFHG